MLTNREIAIYALGKTEGVNSIAETLGKGLDDEKYIESWNKIMKIVRNRKCHSKNLKISIMNFAKKMETVVNSNESKQEKP